MKIVIISLQPHIINSGVEDPRKEDIASADIVLTIDWNQRDVQVVKAPVEFEVKVIF